MIISDGYNGTPTGFENCCEDDEGLTRWDVYMLKQMPF
jgi:dCMP deaminase